MRTLAILAALSYLISGVAISGTQLCVDPQGHAVYEVSDSDCCGGEETAEAVVCAEGQSGEVLVAAPSCGGCKITKPSLPTAPIGQVATALPALSCSIDISPELMVRAARPVSGTAMPVPRMSLQLRC